MFLHYLRISTRKLHYLSLTTGCGSALNRTETVSCVGSSEKGSQYVLAVTAFAFAQVWCSLGVSGCSNWLLMSRCAVLLENEVSRAEPVFCYFQQPVEKSLIPDFAWKFFGQLSGTVSFQLMKLLVSIRSSLNVICTLIITNTTVTSLSVLLTALSTFNTYWQGATNAHLIYSVSTIMFGE